MALSWRVALALCICVIALVACAADDPPAKPSQILQANDQLHWYRGNVHTHTLWSDGDDFPESVVTRYQALGYNFLALTEHNKPAQGDAWILPGERPGVRQAIERLRGASSADANAKVRPKRQCELAALAVKPGKFLLMQGEAISDSVGPASIHLNAIHVPGLIEPAQRPTVDETIAADIAAAQAAGQAAGRYSSIISTSPIRSPQST